MQTNAAGNGLEHGRSGRRPVVRAVAALTIAAASLVGASVASSVASAAPGDPVGCGYGTGGPFADTLCWIDMSGYVDATARSGSGQAMSATLPGGYTVDFTVRTSGTRNAVPSIFPTWDYGAAVGKYIYLSTPGQPALYQTTGQGAADTTFSLTDIAVTDAGGNAVHGWRFVGVDAESTADSESITFSSDVPVSTLATFAPEGGENGCQVNIQQIDANTIRCSGSNIGDKYGTILVGATEPGTFTQTMTVGNAFSREGVAFAFQSSTISLDAVVTGRAAASDSFDLSVLSPESSVVGTAGTGSGDAASTGDLVVLPRVDGSSYTLRETGGAGTDLAGYDLSWACTRDGVADPSLSATGVDEIIVSPAAGEDIACTVTNAVAQVPPTTTTTTAAPTTTTSTAAPTTVTTAPTTTAAPAPTSTGTLPQTGPPSALPLAFVGSALVAMGALVVRTSRRRRQD